MNLSPSRTHAGSLDEDASAAIPARDFAFPRAAVLDRRLPDAVALTALFSLTAIVAWQRLWLWNGLAYLDVSTFYMPWYSFLGEHLRNFQIPGWNPNQFIGTPFAGDPQSGWMYFPAMFFFTILPPVAAYKWFLIFHLAMAGVSTYVFARLLRLGAIGSLAAASAYEFGPFVNHVTCCLNDIQLAVWIPPALVGIELAHRAGRRWTRLAWWSLSAVAVSQIFAGWVGQGAYNGALVVGSYLVFRTLFATRRDVDARGRWSEFIRGTAAIFGGGFAIAAAGLLPRLFSIQATNVSGGEYTGSGSENYSSGWSVSLLFHRLMGGGNSYFSMLFYLGAATIALAIAALFLARRNSVVFYFAGLTFVVSILCLAKPTIIHELFFILPRYKALYEHVPTRVAAVLWLGPAVLAGAAIDALARGAVGRNVRRAAVVIVALWAVIELGLLTMHAGMSWTSLAVVVVVCAALAVYAYLPEPPRAMSRDLAVWRRAVAIILLAAIIFEPTGRIFLGAVLNGQADAVNKLPTGPVSTGAIDVNVLLTDAGGAGEFLQKVQADGQLWRFFGYDNDLQYGGWAWPSTYREWYFAPEAQSLLINARAMMLNLDDVQGYDPVQLSLYVNFLNTLNNQSQNYHDAQILPSGLTSPLLNLLNARYIIVPNDLAAGRPRADLLAIEAKYPVVFQDDQVKILENPAALPRAWIVHDVGRATVESQLAVLSAEQIDPRQVALIAGANALPSVSKPAAGANESVTVTDLGSDAIVMHVNLQSGGLVVVSEAYASGWNAYVDGKKTPVYLTDGVLRSVAVPAGAHVVDLRYEPASLTIGLWISGAAGVLVLAVVAAAVWERRRAIRLLENAGLTVPSAPAFALDI